ncbi:hypothetical protein VE01_03403 [Pseudogymnoascus verrucosus]|uniref:Uncharacterized protein n=1 Tax=Pseudogymnoascus verrucosus TaxID=342668 RepID=A0A1B8GSC2_9PEZI|nr:uncharacterized protein VE01_03403 [Pseudogymnoascus verrucosus]OBT98721.1 hypothetical protein VE01_03403 [Pseudogymnoascus verrucosus]
MNPLFPEKPSSGPSQQPPSYTAAPSYPPAPPSFSTSFASLSLHRSDRIRCLQFPTQTIDGIRATIKASYPFGIQRESPYGPSHEFKLCSYPWSGQGRDAIPSRIVMREILAYLYRSGWIFHVSTDCSKKELDKDTIVFRQQQAPPPPAEWIAISFNQSDRLRLIGADEMLKAAVREVLVGMRLLQEEAWKDRALGAWEFKIHGRPWVASGEQTMSTRLLLLRLLECLEKHGLSLYASIDQSQGQGEGTSETDSWYCVRDKTWVPGAHVFHR